MIGTPKANAIDGEVLRLERLRNGLTYRDLQMKCAVLGCYVDASWLSKIEKRGWGMGTRKLPVLAQVLGVEVSDLLLDRDEAKAA